jgi:hypothetical protein
MVTVSATASREMLTIGGRTTTRNADHELAPSRDKQDIAPSLAHLRTMNDADLKCGGSGFLDSGIS